MNEYELIGVVNRGKKLFDQLKEESIKAEAWSRKHPILAYFKNAYYNLKLKIKQPF